MIIPSFKMSEIHLCSPNQIQTEQSRLPLKHLQTLSAPQLPGPALLCPCLCSCSHRIAPFHTHCSLWRPFSALRVEVFLQAL